MLWATHPRRVSVGHGINTCPQDCPLIVSSVKCIGKQEALKPELIQKASVCIYLFTYRNGQIQTTNYSQKSLFSSEF